MRRSLITNFDASRRNLGLAEYTEIHENSYDGPTHDDFLNLGLLL